MSCIRDHGLTVSEDLAAVACHRAEQHQEWRFAQGENSFAALYHYKSRDFAVGSAAHYRWKEWGYQETVLHLRLGERPEAAVWINHPGETIQFGYSRPSFWGGCGTLPRVQQYRGVAVLDFSTFDEQPDFTHAWFPIGEFDESSVKGSLALARSGRGTMMLRGSTDFVVVKDGPSANAELRQYGRKTRWIVRVCEASNLAAAQDRFGALAVEDKEDGSLVVEDPEYGTVAFRPDGSAAAEGRTVSPKDFTVAGEVTMLAAN
ncbi:hypothetical protein ACFSQT_23125 [Mesorhizobium calcicola]|uniref:Uncharacterized protein n=1 Tax=Mesorhizobium calcicola TaxID=1300310 RepID=A0ABW4WGY5_9HYPH